MTFMLWFVLFLGVTFLSSGTIFFLAGSRYISYRKDRDRLKDEEVARLEASQNRFDEELQKIFSGKVYSPTDFYGEKKNARTPHKFDLQFKEEPGDPEMEAAGSYDSPPEPVTEMDLVSAYPDETSVQIPIYSNVSVSKEDVEMVQPNMVDVVREEIRKAEIKEAQFEESGGHRNPGSNVWVNYARAYWDDSLKEPSVIDDKLVYPTQSQATDSALRTAHRLGMTQMFPQIINDYAVDIAVNRVIVEWIDESDSGK